MWSFRWDLVYKNLCPFGHVQTTFYLELVYSSLELCEFLSNRFHLSTLLGNWRKSVCIDRVRCINLLGIYLQSLCSKSNLTAFRGIGLLSTRIFFLWECKNRIARHSMFSQRHLCLIHFQSMGNVPESVISLIVRKSVLVRNDFRRS